MLRAIMEGGGVGFIAVGEGKGNDKVKAAAELQLLLRRLPDLAWSGYDSVTDWLVAHGDDVLTGDSFFHLSAYGQALPGLNLCGAGRVVCLIDPIGDVYACPFAIHEQFLAGNVRNPGGFDGVWKTSDLFLDLRSPQTGGACTQCSAYALSSRPGA